MPSKFSSDPKRKPFLVAAPTTPAESTVFVRRPVPPVIKKPSDIFKHESRITPNKMLALQLDPASPWNDPIKPWNLPERSWDQNLYINDSGNLKLKPDATKLNEQELNLLPDSVFNYKSGGKIHIKKANRGKFTASAKKAGKSVQAHASSVLANPNASPLQKKRANFARNAAKWKHPEGGVIGGLGEGDPDFSKLAPGWERRLGYPASTGSVTQNWTPTEKTIDPATGGFVTKFKNEHAGYFTPQSIAATGFDKTKVDDYGAVTSNDMENYDNPAVMTPGVRQLFAGNNKFNQVESVRAGYVNPARMIHTPASSYEVPYEATVAHQDYYPADKAPSAFPTTLNPNLPQMLQRPIKKKGEPDFFGSTSATDIGVSRKGQIWSNDKSTRRPTKFSR